MRQRVAGGPPEMVLERSAAQGIDFNCPETPGHPCILQEKEGQELVFYAFDPVRGKGERLGQFKTQGSPSIGWGLSRDGSASASLWANNCVSPYSHWQTALGTILRFR